jgi:hypothetical protein
MAFTGVNFVRASRHALQTARKLWPVTSDRFELRRQALKLRFWDEGISIHLACFLILPMRASRAYRDWAFTSCASTTRLVACQTSELSFSTRRKIGSQSSWKRGRCVAFGSWRPYLSAATIGRATISGAFERQDSSFKSAATGVEGCHWRMVLIQAGVAYVSHDEHAKETVFVRDRAD